jgi:dTDP-4-amino-4,6-dideoxygalactose transaminase
VAEPELTVDNLAAVPAIPFNRPAIEGNELAYVRAAIEGGHTSSSGPFSVKAADALRAEMGAEEVLLTTSCTSALELSALLLDLQPGDSVVVPSFTFTTSALAFARSGARLLFCDIEPRTLGMDPAHLETLLDDSVRAVVLVHYAGIACDVEGIRKALKDRPEVAVIEDNAHGLFGRWRGEPLGSLGRFATQSFHDTKNFLCGEGGALVINEARDVDRARVLYDKGTNRRAFMMGQVDKYSWKDTGSSFGLSDTLAAHLWGQLECREIIQRKRRVVFDRYAGMMTDVAGGMGVTLPVIPGDCESAYHMYHLLLPDRRTRDEVLVGMREQGVQATFHYVPLHSSDAGRRFAAHPTECPVTDDVSGRLLRFPFYNNLTPAEADQVVSAFTRSLAGAMATRG